MHDIAPPPFPDPTACVKHQDVIHDEFAKGNEKPVIEDLNIRAVVFVWGMKLLCSFKDSFIVFMRTKRLDMKWSVRTCHSRSTRPLGTTEGDNLICHRTRGGLTKVELPVPHIAEARKTGMQNQHSAG